MAPLSDEQHQSGIMDNWVVNRSMVVTFQILGENRTYQALFGSGERAREMTSPTYDSQGAVYYVLAVILIYGVSIVLLILATIRGKHYHEHMDKQVSSYLRNVEAIRQRGETENILKRHDLRSLNTATSSHVLLDRLPLIREIGETSDDLNHDSMDDKNGSYYRLESPMPTPRMERRLSQSDPNFSRDLMDNY